MLFLLLCTWCEQSSEWFFSFWSYFSQPRKRQNKASNVFCFFIEWFLNVSAIIRYVHVQMSQIEAKTVKNNLSKCNFLHEMKIKGGGFLVFALISINGAIRQADGWSAPAWSRSSLTDTTLTEVTTSVRLVFHNWVMRLLWGSNSDWCVFQSGQTIKLSESALKFKEQEGKVWLHLALVSHLTSHLSARSKSRMMKTAID